MTDHWIKGQMLRGFLIVMAISTAVALSIPDRLAIDAMNVIAFGFSGAVMVAYAAPAWQAARAERPTLGQVLAFGIFLTQSGTFLGRGVSIARRSLNLPQLSNTDFVSLVLMLTVLGAMCHLNAPEIVDGAVPKKQWIKIGVLFGLFAAVAAVIVTYAAP